MRQLLAALALTVMLVPQAQAWNQFGHMVVAAVAYDQLTPRTRERVRKLLKLNPSYQEWVQGADDPDRAAFLNASTWPDDIKFMSGYKNDGETAKGPAASANLGYVDHYQHRYWHYVDLPFSPDHTPLIQPQTPNALTQIIAFRKSLASDASDDVKSYDLVWLLHLVGDVHQPLHATSRFTIEQPKGDAGGNKVLLCFKPKCRDELHAEWDELLGRSKKPEDAVKKALKLPAPDRRLVSIDNPEEWVKESFELAQKKAYTSPIGDGPGPYKLDAPYRAAAREVAQAQVALAGARLARLLNAQLN